MGIHTMWGNSQHKCRWLLSLWAFLLQHTFYSCSVHEYLARDMRFIADIQMPLMQSPWYYMWWLRSDSPVRTQHIDRLCK
ncbi:hypothetical protein BX666DRAFT_1955623 [Dichotomocladium elegans]|nr:hypothetical protein BX666DRAFT_1955623 [Dichotomocladium elegans]